MAGGDKKEESGFGFKDEAKALETLRLLGAHDVQYRRLTVRGLLGRAKRVLAMTKAEDKVKNIKEAMAVFENWLEEQKADRGSEKKEKADRGSGKKTSERQKEKDSNNGKEEKDSASDDDMKEDKPEEKKADTVSGLGFKDAEAARGTLAALEGRDPDYQKLAVKGLIGRARRVLSGTRDETKLSNIKEAVQILEQFLERWEREGRGANNCAYLSLDVVEACLRVAAGKGVAPAESEPVAQFLEAYRSVGGDYKRLRTVTAPPGNTTWDVVRNAELEKLKQKHADAELTDGDGNPTERHLEMALWAFSPLPYKLRPLSDAGRTRKRSGEQSGQAKKSKV